MPSSSFGQATAPPPPPQTTAEGRIEGNRGFYNRLYRLPSVVARLQRGRRWKVRPGCGGAPANGAGEGAFFRPGLCQERPTYRAPTCQRVMLPMIYFRNRHPINLVFLFLFTVCVSFSVGLGCLSAKGIVIFEAASITLVVVVGLTGYTFWAAKRGHDFEFLGPFLVAACLVLMLYALVQIVFPMGKTATMVYGCVAALVFSGFIIYDTDNLIKRYTYDEYVAAAITLYLDIINLFMALVTELQAAN